MLLSLWIMSLNWHSIDTCLLFLSTKETRRCSNYMTRLTGDQPLHMDVFSKRGVQYDSFSLNFNRIGFEIAVVTKSGVPAF